MVLSKKFLTMRNASILGFIALLFFAGCEDTPQTENQNTPENTSEQKNTADGQEQIAPDVRLIGLAATSTAAGFPVENLIDGDPKTHWQCMKGAAQGEEITFWFSAEKESLAETLTVECRKGDGFSEIKKLEIFINENSGIEILPGEKMQIGEPLKSLTIRLKETAGLKTVFKKYKTDKIEIRTPEDAARFGIAEVTFSDKAGKRLKLSAPTRLEGIVTASSVLNPEYFYTPSRLFDNRLDFAWVEGAAGDGTGEILNFQFKNEVNITAIQIWNGYQRSQSHFDQNGKIRDFELSDGENNPVILTLRNSEPSQKLLLETPVKSKNLKLKIKNIYPGKKFKDLAISELRFFDSDQPFVINPVFAAEELKNNPLVGKYILNKIEKEDFTILQSIIFYPDGTYSFHSSEESPTDDSRIWESGGGWQVLKNSPTNTEIKLTGVSRSKLPDGSWEKFEGFAETMIITQEQITGGRAIHIFWLP